MRHRFLRHCFRTTAMACALSTPAWARSGDGLIETRWVGAVSGTWWETSNWSNGRPHNSGDNFYRAIIDAAGAPYTVLAHAPPGLPGVGPITSEVILDSKDATLDVASRFYTTSPDSAFYVLNGTLSLRIVGSRIIHLGGHVRVSDRFEWVNGARC